MYNINMRNYLSHLDLKISNKMFHLICLESQFNTNKKKNHNYQEVTEVQTMTDYYY